MRIKLFISLLIIILLTGCSDKYFACKVNLDNKEDNYKLNSVYKIYYKNDYVINIEKEDKYISTNNDILDYYYEYKNIEYKHFKDLYGGYEYNLDYNNDILKINVNINMNEVNLKQMVLDNILDKNYVISNKLTKTGIKRYYESKGAICDI